MFPITNYSSPLIRQNKTHQLFPETRIRYKLVCGLFSLWTSPLLYTPSREIRLVKSFLVSCLSTPTPIPIPFLDTCIQNVHRFYFPKPKISLPKIRVFTVLD